MQSLKQYQQLITEQVNQTMRKAGFWAALLGFLCATLLLGIVYSGLMQHMEIPAYWALFCGLYSLVLYGMARTGRLKGILQYIIYLPFVSLPGIVLLLSHLYLPAGSATYLNGPPIYLYFFVIFMSGFFFSRLLSILAGLLAGAQYFIFYLLASDHIATITAADELVQQDLTSPEIYFFRALMIVAAGPITAVLSENSKKLMLKMLNEQ
ncbi:MAG: hypothetical protein KDK34_16855, partial [Leptospiraceae bacterium]|nr:hypothetical protein [Leptospiraceae bacterium]